MNLPRRLEDYIPFVGEEIVEQIVLMASHLQGAKVQHINSSHFGGGVAEILNHLVPLMNDVGLETKWTVIEGPEVFFDLTKNIHMALHGASAEIDPEMSRVYRKVMLENAAKIQIDADFVIIHDPQPLGLVRFRSDDKAQWIWRCHIDVSQADRQVWGFLKPFIDRFDAALFHIPQFLRTDLSVPQYIVPPFIEPLSDKNRELVPEVVERVLERYQIPKDRPFILQASRFDRLKDPIGALEAYAAVRRSLDVGFVMVGNFAPDDPEGKVVLEEVVEVARRIPDAIIIPNPEDNDVTVNALQRAASVVLQKSVREGFGLSVTEAMWKAKPVVGGDTGGIAFQVIDGVNGFLVQTVEGATYRLRQLLSNPPLAQLIGQEAHRRVRTAFLPPYALRNWLCVLSSVRNPDRGVSVLGG